MTSTSEAISKSLTAKWKDPEFRAKVKRGHDRHYTALMKKRLVELAKGES